jgi:6-pyruvoyltetrahydropterin/6-carboxytetrahydropterin synthase
MGIYEICVQAEFSAAHSLRGYPGNCASTHGHNWIIRVFIKCHKLNELGIGIDFRDVKQVLHTIMEDFDHQHLNELAVFKDSNPTSELIAQYFYQKLSQHLNTNDIKISKVKISESPGTGVCYWEE